jgi:hypothetical protein
MRGEPAIDESDFNLSFNVASGVSSQDRPIPAVRDRFLISYIDPPNQVKNNLTQIVRVQ